MGHRILAAPISSPVRMAMIDWLKSRYPAISDLQKAWQTDVDDWDRLRGPSASAVGRRDSDEFTRAFIQRYFDLARTLDR